MYKIFMLCLYVCVSVWVCEYVGTRVVRGQKRPLDLLELELELVVSHPHGFWEPNFGALKAQSVLRSAEP